MAAEPALLPLAPLTHATRVIRTGRFPEAECAGPRPSIPGYTLIAELGRGSMGVVYQALHHGLNRQVALKMILLGAHADPALVSRFWSETQTVAKLQHPGIVQVYDSGWCDGLPYCALELLPGGTLADRLDGQPWQPSKAAELVLSLASTIHAAHVAGVVHRDLKPANLLFTADEQPKVTDFGIAKDLQNPESGCTRSGDILGTPAYMAPEQALGTSKDVGPAADVYALGVLLYELLTGARPFEGSDPLDVLIQVRNVEPSSLRRRVAAVPFDLDVICLKCLEKDPTRRYPSAQALAEDLQRFLDDRPILARRVSDFEKVCRWGRRNPLVAGLLGGIVGLFLAAFVVVASSYYRVEAALRNEAQQRQEAQAREQAERWERYRANIAAAATGLQLHNVDIARQALEAAPARHRNWEWRHFARQLDSAAEVRRWPAGFRFDAFASPDGSTLLLSHEGRVWVRHTFTGVDSPPLAVPPDTPAGVSADGRLLAWMRPDRVFEFGEAATGRHIVSVPGPKDAGPHFRFSADGTAFVTFAPDWSLQLREATTGKVRHTFPGPRRPVAVFDWSAAGHTLAIWDAVAGAVSVWDAHSGQVTQSWRLPAGCVVRGILNRAGDRLLLAHRYPETALQLWDTTTGKLVATMTGHRNQVGSLAFSNDGTRIATGSLDQTIRVWEGRSGAPLLTLQGHRGWVDEVNFNPTGTRLVSGSQDNTLRLWNVLTGESLGTLIGHTAGITSARFSADGRRIVSASHDNTLRIWEVEAAERCVLRGHEKFAYGVAFHPDGQRVASAAWDGTVRLWDATNAQQLACFNHEPGSIVTSVAFAPTGHRLASRGRDSTLRLWNSTTGREEQRWTVAADTWRDTRVAYSPRGDLIATGAADHSVRLYAPGRADEVAILRGHRDVIRAVAFSPDGRWLASASEVGDPRVRVWDLSTFKQVQELEHPDTTLYCVAFSPDGKTLASGAVDGMVRLWDTTTWHKLTELKHGTRIYDVTFSPDGSRLASACANNTIRFWDTTTRQEVAELRGHDEYVHALAFSPDGTRLASASGDRTVRIWDTLSPAQRARR